MQRFLCITYAFQSTCSWRSLSAHLMRTGHDNTLTLKGLVGRERELENEFAFIWLKSKIYTALMPLDGIVVCCMYLCSISLLILRIPFNARHLFFLTPNLPGKSFSLKVCT